MFIMLLVLWTFQAFGSRMILWTFKREIIAEDVLSLYLDSQKIIIFVNWVKTVRKCKKIKMFFFYTFLRARMLKTSMVDY